MSVNLASTFKKKEKTFTKRHRETGKQQGRREREGDKQKLRKKNERN
jgi:hypothetical protein